MVYLNAVLFIAGLTLLVKGSDYFTRSAASIAKRLGVSDFIIGLTLVAIATSLPELASSILAAARRQSGIVIGNVVGSNIANTALIVGITAIVIGIKTRKTMIQRDGGIMLFVSVLFLVFAIGGTLSRLEAGFFLLLYLAYIMFLFRKKPRGKEEYQFKHFLDYFLRFKYLLTLRTRLLNGVKNHSKSNNKKLSVKKKKLRSVIISALLKDVFILVFSGAAIFIGADFVIDQAIFFAQRFGVPESFIAISIIAVGTSIPELSVSLTAARKGYGNIAFGNIVGSSISNILLVLGTAGLIFPLAIERLSIIYTIPVMIGLGAVLLIFARSDWEIRNIEGLTLLIIYALFMIILFQW